VFDCGQFIMILHNHWDFTQLVIKGVSSV